MAGPLPIPESHVRVDREEIRQRAKEVRKNAGLLWQNVQGKRTFINVHSVDVGQYGTGPKMTSILRRLGASVGGVGGIEDPTGSDGFGLSASQSQSSPQRQNQDRSRNGGGANRTATSSGRALSSNYEWRDYDDLIQDRPLSDEDEEDEDYNDAPRRSNRGRRLNDADGGSDSSDAMDVDSSDDEATGGGRSRRRRRRSQSRSPSRRRNRRSNSRGRSIRFDDDARQQPSRTSSRNQQRARRTYDDPDSSDDDLVEMMSTNTTPTGEYVDDYNVLGHMFRIPEGSRINRAWVSRMESHLGMCGKKKYAPQVGDSVVYIPKAHYDTVRAYPTGNNSSAPWKSWPKSSAWPVVRCSVKDVRYRFPYEQYFRSRSGDAITSIVAILKLEVTGIPLIASDGSFPWPKPEFISRQTRSSSITFEVSVFENDQVDFIVPEHLYTWKIEALQDAISARRNARGLEYTSYFQPSGEDEGAGVEDAEFIPYGSEITDMVISNRDREIHFKNSGYNAFGIVWDSGDSAFVSAWEGVLTEKKDDLPQTPGLEDEDKTQLLEILDKVQENPLVESWFAHPVDTGLFTDYLNMVELPMDLTIIRTRLELDYYTNVLSILADVRLIRDNCTKYNERHADITEAAWDMYEKFEEMCSDLKEKAAARAPVGAASRQRTESSEGPAQEQGPVSPRASRANRRSAALANEGATRSSRRALRSSLENLGGEEDDDEAEEDQAESRTRSGRRSLRISISAPSTGRSSSRTRRSTRASADGGAAAPSEDEAEENGYLTPPENDEDAGTSSRRRSSRGASAAPTRSSPRRGQRGVTSSYEEVDSDADEQESSAEEEEEHNESSAEEEEEKAPVRSSRRQSSRRSKSPPAASRGGSRSSPRSRKKSSVRYTEVESDEEIYQEEDDASASDEEEENNTRRGRKRGATASAAPQGRTGRSTSRRRVASRQQDGSDSESSISAPNDGESSSEDEEEVSDNDDASSEDSDEFVPNNRASSKRRKRSNGANGSAKKKSRDSKSKSGDLYYPTLSKWPPIVDIRDITSISKKILSVCAEADTDGIFAIPVTEAFPEVAESYLSVISDPMDFRTIEEERIPMYQDMVELQEDLIKVFKNCCVYNGEGSDYYHYAVNIWEGLNNTFKEACEEEGIIVPRRWT